MDESVKPTGQRNEDMEIKITEKRVLGNSSGVFGMFVDGIATHSGNPPTDIPNCGEYEYKGSTVLKNSADSENTQIFEGNFSLNIDFSSDSEKKVNVILINLNLLDANYNEFKNVTESLNFYRSFGIFSNLSQLNEDRTQMNLCIRGEFYGNGADSVAGKFFDVNRSKCITGFFLGERI